MKNLCILFVVVIFIASCSEPTSGMRYTEDNLYVSVLLKAGEYIEGENSLKFGETLDIELAEYEALPDTTAVCIITEKSPAGEIITELNLVWSSEARGYIDINANMQIKAGYTYILEITTMEQKSVYAETTVPQEIIVRGDMPESGTAAWGESINEGRELVLDEGDLLHPVIIETADDNEFNLYSEFWCMEEYYNAEFTYPEDDNEYPEDEEEYMGDTRQYPRRNIGFYMYQPQDGILSFNSYQASILFYGNTKLKLYSIDDNYLNYLYKADGYKYGGITGGIGIFGSYSGRELYTRVIKS